MYTERKIIMKAIGKHKRVSSRRRMNERSLQMEGELSEFSTRTRRNNQNGLMGM
jgi:hypothetical protein